MDRIAPGNQNRRRQAAGDPNASGTGNRERMGIDDSGLELARNHGLHLHRHSNQAEGDRYEEGDFGEEYEENLEYTINEGIDPDDLIRTMEPAQIEKFIPKKPYEILVKIRPELENEKCTICLDQVKNGEVLRSIPLCQHVFHAECLLNWLLVNEICPNCKNEVSIYTLKAYFDSIKASKSKKKEDRNLQKKEGESPASRSNIFQEPQVSFSRLQPSESILIPRVVQPAGHNSTGQTSSSSVAGVGLPGPRTIRNSVLQRANSAIEEEVIEENPSPSS